MNYVRRVGQKVYVRMLSMTQGGWADTPGIVVQVNPGPTYNVEREDGQPVANGQREVEKYGDTGVWSEPARFDWLQFTPHAR